MVDAASPSSTPTTMRWTEPGAFTVDISRRRDRVMVLLSGELDIATAPLLGELLTTAGAGIAVHITLDLSQLAFIDVTGLTTILHTRSALQSRQGDLTIHAPSRCVRRLLDLANLTSLVTTPPTRDQGQAVVGYRTPTEVAAPWRQSPDRQPESTTTTGPRQPSTVDTSKHAIHPGSN